MLKLLIVAAVVGVAVSSANSCTSIKYPCYYDGNCYGSGTILPNKKACFQMKCDKTSWVATGVINAKCANCSACDDPHFRTYEGFHYDYHGKCNYTLTQNRQGSYNPDFGVFSQFILCGSYPSCLKTVVFQDISGTVITIPFPLISPIPHSPASTSPVISWPHPGSGCWRYQGTDLAMEVCNGCVRIWAHRGYHQRKLNGLCGLLSDTISDDFTTRQGNGEDLEPFYPASSLFADTWATDDQANCRIRSKRSVEDCPRRDEFRNLCTNNVPCIRQLPEPTKTEFINNCVFDICANPKDWNDGLQTYDDRACHVLDILKHTEDIGD